MFPISWIIYSGCTGIRDDPNLGRIAASSGIDTLVNGGHQHAEVQGDGDKLQRQIKKRWIYLGRLDSKNPPVLAQKE